MIFALPFRLIPFSGSSGNLSGFRRELTGTNFAQMPTEPDQGLKAIQMGREVRGEMRTMAVRSIRITHRSSGEVIAEGPLGLFGITPFEGNLYIRRKYLKTSHLRPNWVPGLCIYKFLYVWLDLRLPNGTSEPFVGWMYWLPNPLLPFIAFRPAVPRLSPALQVEEIIG